MFLVRGSKLFREPLGVRKYIVFSSGREIAYHKSVVNIESLGHLKVSSLIQDLMASKVTSYLSNSRT